MHVDLHDHIANVLNQTPVNAKDIIENSARSKSAFEIERMRRAAAIADAGVQALHDEARVGLKEFELAAIVEYRMRSLGAEDNFGMVVANQHIQALHPPTDRVVQPGDIIIGEITPCVGGLFVQICRTMVLGQPPAVVREKYAILKKAMGFGMDAATTGAPASAVAAAINGTLCDAGYEKYCRPPFMRGAVPGPAASLLVLATHPPLWVMIVALVFMTASFAVAYGPYLALLADLVPSGARGRVNGALQVGGMAGQIAILALATMLWEGADSLLFIVVALGLLLGVATVVVMVREARHAHLSTAPIRPMRWLRDIAAQRQVVRYLIATFFFWFAFGGLAPFLTRFGVYELGTSEQTAMGLFLVVVISTIVCALPVGWLADRYGKRRMMLVGLVFCAGAAIVGSQVRTVEQAFVMLSIVGVGNALATVPQLPLLTDLIARERAGEMSGVGGAVWELSQPLGAIFAGGLADIVGTLRISLLMAGVSLAIAALLLTRVTAPPAAPRASTILAPART